MLSIVEIFGALALAIVLSRIFKPKHSASNALYKYSTDNENTVDRVKEFITRMEYNNVRYADSYIILQNGDLTEITFTNPTTGFIDDLKKMKVELNQHEA